MSPGNSTTLVTYAAPQLNVAKGGRNGISSRNKRISRKKRVCKVNRKSRRRRNSRKNLKL